jgi:hypothetical protein
MAVQRQVRRADVGPGRVRVRVVITGDPCAPPPSYEARTHHYLFMQLLANNQDMLQCGYAIPERIVITHNGTSWQADCEAESDETPA